MEQYAIIAAAYNNWPIFPETLETQISRPDEIGSGLNRGKRPEIYSITSNVTRQEGKRVRLVCKVRGQPPPKVTWFKDKRSINRNVTKYAQVHLK
ncbi:conserved hypothetical protein [Culex quinquefasciatus]|uniref:Ig-like domain-containing protein n=1 Tax=Culex quinquefasciatus TaxID=7176 RepID=B0WD22_CULQU|nr:conserved hypothetical protein [Culex quinquefasciatus]|eukprot:XP_001846606.1 conserved hypothetical protein [Culex quinquefasciatus]